MLEEIADYTVEEDVSNQNEYLKLAKAIGKLDKSQHIKKPSRDGNSAIKSEFHVSNSHTSNDVVIHDLINVLQKSSEHVDTSKKIKIAQEHSKTLQRPVEKHEAEKIKRLTGFEEVKKSLGKWDAIVTRNQAIEHQKFPIDNEKVEKLQSKEYLSKFSIKSELEKELDELIPEKIEDDEDEGMFPMTMSELLEHRKETARLRAKQSYKEAKARRQKKIKSKKFHRIERKKKIKEQLKEFEQLQKTDPEEALKRLEQLEKTRAQERVTLRHKSTGQWAKNKLVRAKYDKETRQQLAEQLAISRELTQKQNVEDTDSEEDHDQEGTAEGDSNNPWLVKTQQSDDVSIFIGGYKKYWEQRNKSLSKNIDESYTETDVCNESKSNKVIQEINTSNGNVHKGQSSIIRKVNSNAGKGIDTLKETKKKGKVQSTTSWQVEEVSDISSKGNALEHENKSIDDIFDNMEWKLKKDISSKIALLKTKKKEKHVEVEDKSDGEYDSNILQLKKQKIRPKIDEEMYESQKPEDFKQTTNTFDVNNLLTNNSELPVNKNDIAKEIDPNKFVAIKPRHLMSALPDMEAEGDHIDDEEDEKKLTIAEAFEDDDIVAEFHQDKENEINKDKPIIEDLSLPGWGSWVGKNVRKPKRKRVIFNALEILPRKDDKKDNVIINENRSAKLRVHQVSELPFPFTSVADYEASIRAPIGNTFIPESAYRKHIKPSVIVKSGIIIQPMDESQLIEKKKMSIKRSHNASYDKPLFKISKKKK